MSRIYVIKDTTLLSFEYPAASRTYPSGGNKDCKDSTHNLTGKGECSCSNDVLAEENSRDGTGNI